MSPARDAAPWRAETFSKSNRGLVGGGTLRAVVCALRQGSESEWARDKGVRQHIDAPASKTRRVMMQQAASGSYLGHPDAGIVGFLTGSIERRQTGTTYPLKYDFIRASG